MSARYIFVTCAISMLLMTIANFVYTTYTIKQSDHKWCELMTFYDDQFKQNPPQTEIQKQVATFMHNRRQSLGCE